MNNQEIKNDEKPSLIGNKHIIWIVYLIVAALVFLANALDFFPTQVGNLGLIVSIILGAIAIASIGNLNFYGVFMPLSIIGIIYSEEFRIEAITPIPILVVAVLLSIAFQLIFKKKV